MKKETNVWKIIAIIFIILFILETILFITLFAIGTKIINDENECSINICGNLDEAVSYDYDDYDKICYCLDASGEAIYQEFIR